MPTQLNTQADHGPPWVGIAWMVLTGLLFVLVTGIVRYIGSEVPAAEAAFIRYAIGLLIMAPFIRTTFTNGIKRKSLEIYAIRGLTHAIGVMLWFYAMAHIPIAEVTAIGYTAPIYITNGAAIFFGERLVTFFECDHLLSDTLVSPHKYWRYLPPILSEVRVDCLVQRIGS